jgi:hypothetical protein
MPRASRIYVFLDLPLEMEAQLIVEFRLGGLASKKGPHSKE